MTYSLAINDRTQIKAAIKRASARARLEMNTLDQETLDELHRIYTQAVENIQRELAGYADDENNLHLESLRDIEQQVSQILQSLSAQRNNLLFTSMDQAAALGVLPYRGVTDAQTLLRVADEAVRFTQRFVADDGLQLSDRIWRLDRGAHRAVTETIQSALVQGWGPSQAATDFLGRGMLGQVGDDIQHVMLTGTGSARYNALRVFRTELNRAHGEAYMSNGEELEDFAGWRFLLSPRHPEPDVCDMHARVNRYGLGPGVYPTRAKCPWPAHPNTLSYTEIVFADEITEQDRLGQTNRLDWLKTQPDDVQVAVLRARAKQQALGHGLLRENEINTPWNVLRNKYEQRGVDLTLLERPLPPPAKLSGMRVFGIDPAELQAYTHEAWRNAPAPLQRLVEQTPQLDAVRVVQSGRSYYQGGSITLARTSMQPRDYSPSVHDVWRHEFGHHVDLHGRAQLSLLSNSKGGLGDSIQGARESLYARTSTQRERMQRIEQDLGRINDGWLSDTFGALTYGRVGWGHSETYYRKPRYAETEVFANLVTIYARQDGSWRYLQQELPELARDFESFLEAFW